MIPGWAPSSVYPQYTCVHPTTANGFYYCANPNAITSGTTEPTWCLTLGCTVLDGGHPAKTWTNTAVSSTAYGNAITEVNGIQLWLGGIIPPTFPIAPSIKSIIWGLDKGTKNRAALGK